jgi:tetratricopeptide (TPR) repeat protein
LKKEYDSAKRDYSEAVRLDPKFAFAYISRGDVHRKKKEYDKAIEDYTEAIRIRPDDPGCYVSRGLTYGDKKEYPRARIDYAAAVRLEPEDAKTFHSRGVAFFTGEEYGRAIEVFSEIIRLLPRHPRAYNSLAWLLATCPKDGVRDGKKAVEYATRACQLTGWKDGFSLDNLAAAHAECGDFKEAVRRQKEAIALGFEEKEVMEGARKRLKLYQDGKPFRDE